MILVFEVVRMDEIADASDFLHDVSLLKFLRDIFIILYNVYI